MITWFWNYSRIKTKRSLLFQLPKTSFNHHICISYSFLPLSCKMSRSFYLAIKVMSLAISNSSIPINQFSTVAMTEIFHYWAYNSLAAIIICKTNDDPWLFSSCWSSSFLLPKKKTEHIFLEINKLCSWFLNWAWWNIRHFPHTKNVYTHTHSYLIKERLIKGCVFSL